MGIHKAILAPELVSRGAVLGVAVCYDVSAEAATEDEDFPHFCDVEDPSCVVPRRCRPVLAPCCNSHNSRLFRELPCLVRLPSSQPW